LEVAASFRPDFRVIAKIMTKSIRDYTKKNRAPKAGTMIGVRMQDEQLARLDAARSEDESRPEAIRRLVDKGLAK